MKTTALVLSAAAIAAGVYWLVQRPGCGTAGAIECPAPELEEGVGVTLKSAEVCRRAGYLCHRRSKFQIVRWPLDKGKLRVRVTLPEFLDEGTARRVQAAAVEGIRAWEGHPFPLIIDTGEFTVRSSDIRVIWTKGLRIEGAAGVSSGMNRKVDRNRLEFSTSTMALGVSPDARTDPASLAYVKELATHEMGHSLGLMHSDRKGDIMFPGMSKDPTRAHATKRDFLTLDKLYTLPNGAMVK